MAGPKIDTYMSCTNNELKNPLRSLASFTVLTLPVLFILYNINMIPFRMKILSEFF